MKWTVETFNGKKVKKTKLKFKKEMTADEVALYFSLKFNGEKGEVLSIEHIE